jgi:hypothetical protein
MAMQRQTVRAGQTSRPCPHDRNPLARGRRAFERMQPLGHRDIGGKPLQEANLDRLAFSGLANTGLFAQGFGRADPGAHAAQDILLPDRRRRSFRRPSGDLADEQRDVDGCRAGRDAGRIVAEVTAIRRHPCLVTVQRRGVVVEVRLIGCGWQAGRNNAGRQRACRHRSRGLPLVFPEKAGTGQFFYQTVNFQNSAFYPVPGPVAEIFSSQIAAFHPWQARV